MKRLRREGLAALAAMGLVYALAAPAKADPKGPGELFCDPGLGGPRDGGVIIDHPPLNTGGLASDTSYYYPYPQLRWQRVADDITLQTSVQIGAIRYWGFYGDDIAPASEVMRIRFYEARAGDGLPDDGNFLYEQSFTNPSRAATGRIVLVDEGAAEYVFDVQLATPVLLEANQYHWLEIVQVGDPDTRFRWEFSPTSDGSGHAYINPTTGDWRRTVWTADVAYQLIAVPEPAALGLLSCTLVLGASRRSRKEVQGRGKRTVVSTVLGLALAASGSPLRAEPGSWNGMIQDLGGPRDGAVIVSHPPLNTGGGASDTSYYYPYPQLRWQRIADDITLGSSATVGSIRYWGFYGENIAPNDELMRIRFYAARPSDGLPDDTNLLYEESFINPSREATGRIILVDEGPAEYVFEVQLTAPFSFQPEVRYWLEVVQVGDPSTRFRWEVSPTSDGSGDAYINPTTGDWRSSLPYSTADAAYELMAVPEPGGLLLLSAGLACAGLKPRRKGGAGGGRTTVVAIALALTLGASVSPSQAEPGSWNAMVQTLGGPRDGEVIVDHPPLNTGGGASDTSYYYPYPNLGWQRLADDMTIGTSAQIGAIRYWGFYDGDIVPSDEVMRIRFYGARAADGLPDDANVFYEESFTNPTRTATGRIVLVDEGPAEYVYDVQLAQPVSLEADQTYWSEIVQVGDPNTRWRWEASPPGGAFGHAYINAATGDWWGTPINVNTAYQLLTVPEPATLGLLSCLTIGALWRGSRKEVRGVGKATVGAIALALALAASASPSQAEPSSWNAMIQDLGGPRDGEVIVDHPPLNTGGGSSDTSYYYPAPPNLRWQREADDITLGASAQVGAVRWWGFYNGDIVPDDEVMRVRFYGARASDGLPDETNILYEESFANPSRVATGRIILIDEGPAEYVYDVQLAQAVSLEANQSSWVEIVQLGDPDTIFRWEVSTATDNPGIAYINPATEDWWRTPTGYMVNNAFQLVTVPEPTALSLLGFLLAVGAWRRSRKEVRGVGERQRDGRLLVEVGSRVAFGVFHSS